MGRARSGRPRKSGDRYASGDLKPEADKGTNELAARRAYLARGADPVLAESPVGVLVARRLLDPECHRIADIYAQARRDRFGSGHAKPSDMTGEARGRGNESTVEWPELRAKRVLAKADRALLAYSPAQRWQFDNFVAFRNFPDWIWEKYLSPAGMPELAFIIEAIELVAEEFGVKRAVTV